MSREPTSLYSEIAPRLFMGGTHEEDEISQPVNLDHRMTFSMPSWLESFRISYWFDLDVFGFTPEAAIAAIRSNRADVALCNPDFEAWLLSDGTAFVESLKPSPIN